MSVFPISLPLYPIMNASDSVERLLEKDAEAAEAAEAGLSEESDKAAQADNDSAVADAGRPTSQITAVERTADTVATPLSRSGADQYVVPGPQAAEPGGVRSVDPVDAGESGDLRDSFDGREASDGRDLREAASGYERQSEAVRVEDDGAKADRATAEGADDTVQRLDKRT